MRPAEHRKAELEANLAALEARLTAACAAAGRDRSELTLIAVTKNYPSSDVEFLAELGIIDVGENKAQEGATKIRDVMLDGYFNLRWHFIGQLQRNKAALAARFGLIHSVDRDSLVQALANTPREHRDTPTDLLIQVDFSLQPGRGGVLPDAVAELADSIANKPELRLRGVMTIAPRQGNPAAAFEKLAEISGRLKAAFPDAGIISAGMSGDLEQAIQYGATHLRVGTALLGTRPISG